MSTEFQIVVRPTAAGTITNSATVSSDLTDPDTGDNTASAETTVNPRGTNMDARPMLLDDRPSPITIRLGRFHAFLTDSATNAPVPGKVVVMRAGATELCSATTGADGQASCAAPLNLILVAILNLRYTATFAGDAQFGASSDEGRLIRLLGLIELL
jgi:hypothetical protein